jgi:hypothetical protein
MTAVTGRFGEKASGTKTKTSVAYTNAFLRDDDTKSPTRDSGERDTNIALAKRYRVNRKTISKWKAREFTSDERMGAKTPRSSLLSYKDEAIILASAGAPAWRSMTPI